MSEYDDDWIRLRGDIQQQRELRDRLLISVYRLTDGNAGPGARCDLSDVASDLGIDQTKAVEVAMRLSRGDGLVNLPTMGARIVELTPAGLDYVEQMIAPAGDVAEILNVVEARRVEAFTGRLQTALDSEQIKASGEVLAEIRDLLQSLQLQLKRPRRGPIKAILAVIRTLLGGVGGNAVYDVLQQMPVIL